MKYLVFILLSIFILSCKKEVKLEHDELSLIEKTKPIETDIEVYNYDEIHPILNVEDDKVHVVNFWATWCLPCIKELPYFETINKEYKDKGVEVLLVSLDFPNQYESKLKPYIKEHDLRSKIVALNDPDMNTWIPKVAEEWSGAIPITIIYNKNKRKFYERSFTFEDLESEIKQFLN